MSQRPPEHPGVILQKEFIEPYGLSHYRVAKATGLQPVAIMLITRGERTITASTSIRLGQAFGVEEDYFLKLQMEFDLWAAKQALKKKPVEVTSLKPWMDDKK